MTITCSVCGNRIDSDHACPHCSTRNYINPYIEPIPSVVKKKDKFTPKKNIEIEKI